MSDDSKIISLSERARLRKSPPERKDPRGPETKAQGAGKSGRASSAPAHEAGPQKPVPAVLVWLYCPTCQTLEYTELAMPNGRTHQVCGTRVEEVEVPVDARAEYSLAELNLRQLENLAELIEGQRARFREYQQRLELAAHQPLSSYPLTEDSVRTMPVAEVDPLGLLVSAFLRQPLQRFRPDPAAATPAVPVKIEPPHPAGEAPGPDKPSP
jgi:hypothetical protein